MRKFGNDLKKDPDNSELRKNLHIEKKNLKKLVIRKKRKYKKNIVNKMSQSHKSLKEFWKLLGNLSDKKSKTSSYVSPNTLTTHFKSLLNTSEEPAMPPLCAENGPLDHMITLDELEEASKVSLPTGKGVGVDNLCNEMISCVIEVCPNLILKFFNIVLQSGEIIPDWLTSYIVPIHKSGAKSDPGNYRGVSLLSCLGKFFLSIINVRLLKFCIENGILSESQLGFMKGNRCSDAHLIIHNLISKYCHKRNKKIYSCFIDLSKAFDTIPRDLLLGKLREVGITGKVFNIIRNIYSNDQAYMKVDGKITKSFPISQGVRQGCVLSPLLFNIFMAGLATKLSADDSGLKLDNKKVNSLFWADDIVLLTETREDLERLLKNVSEYCNLNKLTINCKKTKCLIFNKTGRLIREKISMNGVPLENVREYKYLGFIFTPSGEIGTGLQDLRDRAFKSFQTLKRKMGDSFNRDIETALGLYDSMIKPILTYASDFWGCLKLPTHNKNPIEIMQMKVLKQILGVRTQTTNLGVLLELGKFTLDLECIKFSVKNWERIRKGDANSLLLDSYKDAAREGLPWISGVEGHLERNNLHFLFNNSYPNRYPFIHKKLHNTMIEKFNSDALSAISNAESKLRTYALFKTEMGRESYLSEIKNTKTRTQLTKLRISDHNLMIEKGRHMGVHRNLRFCPFCTDKVEDEVHFLLNCPVYNNMRKPVLDSLGIENMLPGDTRDSDIFISLMTNSLEEVATFTKKSFELREFLINKPKRLS